MYCCRCGSENHTKSGVNKGKQRYRCRECGYNFTNTHGRGYPPEMQLKALKLYSENMGLRSIARHMGVDPATVMHWVRGNGLALLEKMRKNIPTSLKDMDIIEIDEMWHFTKKNSENYGYGLLYLVPHDEFSPSKLALVVVKHSSDYGQKSVT